jgi:hypothetical protein
LSNIELEQMLQRRFATETGRKRDLCQKSRFYDSLTDSRATCP